jgi:hypothetical protein
VSIEEDSTKVRRSPYERYKERLTNMHGGSHLQELTLLEWSQDYNFVTFQIRPSAAQRVIQYFPRCASDPTSALYKDYCRVKLMLHHPFTDVNNLLLMDGDLYNSYSTAFAACQQSTTFILLITLTTWKMKMQPRTRQVTTKMIMKTCLSH